MEKVPFKILQDYWDNNLHDHEVTTEPEGSVKFYRDLEQYHYEKLEYLPKLLRFKSYVGKNILDIGCGVGIDLINYSKAGAHVTGIDISPKNIALAKRYFDQNGLSGELLVMNGEDLTFADNVFDMVLAHAVLAYTPDPQRLLSEIYRVLKPGGHTILMSYHTNSWLFYFAKIMNYKLGREDSPIFRTYSANEFRNLLKIFNKVEIIFERFPVATRIHEGFFANIFNNILVPIFILVPKKLIRRFGAHIIAIAYK